MKQKQTPIKTLAHIGGILVILWLGLKIVVGVGNWAYDSARDYFYGQIEGYGHYCNGGLAILSADGRADYIGRGSCNTPENKARKEVIDFYEKQLRNQ